MTSSALTIRAATPEDLGGVDDLLARSYPVLLRPDYPPSVRVLALPLITRAQPALLASGTYHLAVDAAGAIWGAGGWTRAGPRGERYRNHGHVRHVVVDHRAVRSGIGRRLMAVTLAQARLAGMQRMLCRSTRTAVPFYRALGFVDHGSVEIELRPGILFPAVEMSLDLR